MYMFHERKICKCQPMLNHRATNDAAKVPKLFHDIDRSEISLKCNLNYKKDHCRCNQKCVTTEKNSRRLHILQIELVFVTVMPTHSNTSLFCFENFARVIDFMNPNFVITIRFRNISSHTVSF